MTGGDITEVYNIIYEMENFFFLFHNTRICRFPNEVDGQQFLDKEHIINVKFTTKNVVMDTSLLYFRREL